MKTNREKLHDALGMVDEDIVQSAMTHAASMKAAHISRRAVLRRRLAILAAACLALTLMAGAILAVPLLTADDPIQTQPPVTVSTDEGQPFYIEEPLARLAQLSNSETVVISDPEVPELFTQPATHPSVQVPFTNYMQEYHVLTFDCEPGETVTIQATSGCLHYIDMPLNEHTDLSWSGDFLNALQKLPIDPIDSTFAGYDMMLTIDPSASCVSLQLATDGYEEGMDDEILDYVVRNDRGEITGAGSIYVCRRYLMTADEIKLLLSVPYVTRAAVLGSVRFTNPAEVTEAQVQEVLQGFAPTIETVRENTALDFSPLTANERRSYAIREIYRTVFPGQRIMGLGTGSTSHANYSQFDVTLEDEIERHFLILADGTWAEYRGHGDCHVDSCHLGCPNAAQYGVHHGWSAGCQLRTTDGRVYELRCDPVTQFETFVLIAQRPD